MTVKTRCLVRVPRAVPRVEYIESNAFRVIHVDGARGALRADRRSVHLTLYSERPRTPDEEPLTVEGPEARVLPTTRLVREVEVEAILDTEAARRIIAVLVEALEHADRVDS